MGRCYPYAVATRSQISAPSSCSSDATISVPTSVSLLYFRQRCYLMRPRTSCSILMLVLGLASYTLPVAWRCMQLTFWAVEILPSFKSRMTLDVQTGVIAVPHLFLT